MATIKESAFNLGVIAKKADKSSHPAFCEGIKYLLYKGESVATVVHEFLKGWESI